ncbi:hypothetical protein BGX23_006906 [Mortierella sp. AD031]|nr:hypothetical protein BGX23_006906 [Mortierella sp. AD031]
MVALSQHLAFRFENSARSRMPLESVLELITAQTKTSRGKKRHYDRPMATPREPTNLTALQQKLFRFIIPRLADFEGLPTLSKKDIYVAASMIANVDMTGARQCFGDQYYKLCDLVTDDDFSAPQDWLMDIASAVRNCAKHECAKVDAHKTWLWSTVELGKLVQDELTNGRLMTMRLVRIFELIRIVSKLCELEMVKRPKETEAMTVKVWHEVFEILFDKTNVSVNT